MRYFFDAIAGAVLMVTFADFNPWLWPHAGPFHDISREAIVGTQSQYDTWATSFKATLQGKVDAVSISAPSSPVLGSVITKTGYTLQRIDFPFPSGPTIQTLVAVPDTVDPDKPLIVALSGHEAPVGLAPDAIFATGGWGEKWAQAGYIVYAPSNCWYSQLGVFSDGTVGTHDYQAVWVKMHTRLMAAVSGYLPTHNGKVVTGLSSGALTAAWWSAIDSSFTSGVYAAHHVSLDFLRENYRVSGTPNSWDIKGLLSYTGLFALTSPRPMQIQIGQQDGFFPDLVADAAVQPYYPGLPRPPSMDEFMGTHLIYEKIWLRAGAPYELHIHSGGHVYDFDAARDFVEAH